MDIHPDDVAAAIALASSMAEETRKERGCLLYAFGQDLAQINRFWLAEEWQNEEALAEHFKTLHMMTFRAGLETLRLAHFSASSYGVTSATVLIHAGG
jgi:quinol monooxygenase YgiN